MGTCPGATFVALAADDEEFTRANKTSSVGRNVTQAIFMAASLPTARHFNNAWNISDSGGGYMMTRLCSVQGICALCQLTIGLEQPSSFLLTPKQHRRLLLSRHGIDSFNQSHNLR